MSDSRANRSPRWRTESRRRLASGALAFALSLLFLPQPALGLNLYDIVQLTKAGYADKEIIDLVRATGSRFALDATSLVRLKEAGVSEAVIEALIEARVPEAISEPEAREPGVPEAKEVSATDELGRTRVRRGEGARRPETAPVAPEPGGPPPAVLPQGAGEREKRFSSFPFEETGPGHGASHQHYALTVNEVPILILRSEARFPQIVDRAEEAVRQLNQLVRSPKGHFFVPESHASVWYRDPSSSHSLRILEVSRGDVIAYQQRSLGNVSATRLAAYWAAILNDYTQLFLFGRPPTELAGLHLGETLGKIHADLSTATSEGAASELLASRVRRTRDHLSSDEKEHLIELPGRVPAEFAVR